MRKVLLGAAIMALIFTSCKKDDVKTPDQKPVITITTPAGGFAVNNMQWLRISPTVTGDSTTTTFMWTLNNDTIGTTKSLLYAFEAAGSYTITFTAKNSAGTSQQQVKVTVAGKTYTNAVTKVFDFLPAPGQFVNGLPMYADGDKDSAMIAKAAAEVTKVDGSGLITLGGFGGYIVMGFDHTIINHNDQGSIIVGGNAFPNWSEPGIISVSVDANGNGLPDDEWYEIAGSEYNSPETIHGYKITYYKPDPNKVAMSDGMYMSDTTYIKWKDNQGQSGYLSKNIFNQGDYYPDWKGDSISFTGTRLTAGNIQDLSGTGTNFVSPAFSYGYSDNWTNTDDRAVIKLSWAVDSKGNYVHLPGIDFVKVATGMRAEAGWLGEISTEVTGVTDLNLSK
jgi:hypothetical protein